jgi:ADP-L-glycero-D-manno-heptose 6-epimerase
MKFFNVYGPNEYHKGEMRSLVAKNTDLIARGETIKLFKSHKDGYADGAQLRDFVYVKDCTAAMLWLFENSKSSGLFNMGSGKARSFVDLMNAIGSALSKKVSIDFVDMPEIIRANYQYFTESNSAKLNSLGALGLAYSLEDGVCDYVNSYLLKADKYR